MVFALFDLFIEKSAHCAPGWGFFSSVGGVDFQEDSANDVLPGLLVSLVISSHSLSSRPPSPFLQTGKAWNRD